MCLGILLGIAATAQADDNVTNIISGFPLDLGGTDFAVGDTGTNNYGEVNSGGSVFNAGNFIIGNNAGANNNATLVTDATSLLQANSSIQVGNSGSDNVLIVTNGGTATSDVHILVGLAATGSSNTVLVTGAGSLLHAGAELQSGNLGDGNSITIAAGGTATSANTVLGVELGSDNNTVLVTGAGSLMQTTGDIQSGGKGVGNSFTIANGGTALSANQGVVGNDVNSVNNTALVTGVGSTWTNLGMIVGVFGSDNTLTIAAGGQVFSGENLNIIGSAPLADNNTVVVTGVGSLWQADLNFFVGGTGSGNSLIITNGGTVGAGRPIIGAVVEGNNNSVVVSGAGSALVMTNRFGVPGSNARVGGAGSFCSLIITNGGLVNFANETRIGASSGTSNNVVLVSGSGSIFRTTGGPVSVGRNVGGNNSMMVADGAVAESLGGNIGSANCSNNTVTITGAGSVWDLGTADLSIPRAAGLNAPNNVLNLSNGGLLTNVASVFMDGDDSAVNIGDGTATASANVNAVALSATSSQLNFNNGLLRANAGGALVSGAGSVNNNGAAAIATDFANSIDVGITGIGDLTKLGTGTLTLSAANTYTGGTTVSDGGLLVNGSLGAGAVTVGTGATLGGNGTISGAVSVSSGGTLFPGTSIGTLTVNNTLTLNAGSATTMEVGAANSSDTVSGLTTLNYGGTLAVNSLGGIVGGETYQLFSATTYVGDFAAVNLPALVGGLSWVWAPTTGTLSVSGTPNPVSITSSVSGGGTSLDLNWSELGWIVQSNSVSVADSGSWFDIANSQTGTNLNITINPGLLNVFYRLRLP